ncbi:MAG: hypothetical protein ACFFCD_11280 [Promethearchaeota archaeon]
MTISSLWPKKNEGNDIDALIRSSLENELKLLKEEIQNASNKIAQFEEKYNMNSIDFLKKFELVQTDDIEDAETWYNELQNKKDAERDLQEIELILRQKPE